MTKRDKLTIYCFGLLQQGLSSIGAVDENGRPNKKVDLYSEQALDVYEYFTEKIRLIDSRHYTQPPEIGDVYPLVVALQLSKYWLLDFGDFVALNSVLTKVKRLLAVLREEAPSEEEFDRALTVAARIYRDRATDTV